MAALDDVLGGRYRLTRLLGQGGMSDVYEAFDETTSTEVAIKIVRSNDPEFAARLTQEAHALESCEHPGLVKLLDVGTDGSQAYLVMELIVGTTLAETLRLGALSSKETAAIGARLADALACVHEQGVVHRDVKPSNIMLSPTGAVLGDFGIATHPEASSLTAVGMTMGTVSYMAPEQLEDHQVGPPADIWSLGIILLECLTGTRVYEGTPSEIMARRLAGPVVLPTGLPAPWKVVLTGMLTQLPADRLDAHQVSELLATHAYDAPWIPPEHGAVLGDETTAIAGVGAGMSDKTSAIQASPIAHATKTFNWGWAVVVAAVVAAVLVVSLILLVGQSPKNSSTTTTTIPSTTTPTTLVGTAGTAALKALKSQVHAGEAAGNVDTASGQMIIQEATLAQSAYAAGMTSTAASDLQLANAAISNGISSHSIGRVEGQLLQSDLGLFAAALNLSSAVATTTSSTSTSSTPPHTTTTVAPTTTIAPTTTVAPTTTIAPTTTVAPTTTSS
jgi:serine/threonine protein kinase